MIVYVIMHEGCQPDWFEPVDLDNPPKWFRADEYTFENGESRESETE